MNEIIVLKHSKELSNDMTVLKVLIDINADAFEFYKMAESKIDNKKLKITFSQLSNIHENTITAFQRRMHTEGAMIEQTSPQETIKGRTIKIFGSLLAAFSSNIDISLISKLEKAENRCLHSLYQAIDQESLTTSTHDLLKQELERSLKTHYFVVELKHSAIAAYA